MERVILAKARILSKLGNPLKIRYKDEVREYDTEKGQVIRVELGD